MTTALAQTPNLDADGLLKVLTGNTKNLNAEQRVSLVQGICEATGLDYRLSPFEFITFQGKEVLYARKNAADQLVRIHGIKLSIVGQETVDGIRVVTCAADAKDGRHTEDVGAVSVKGIVGDALANAMMKAVTKAKRRTVLSICGLSMLDESELETIPGARLAVAEPLEPLSEAAQHRAENRRAAEAPKALPTPPASEPASGSSPTVEALWDVLVSKVGEVGATEAWRRIKADLGITVRNGEMTEAQRIAMGKAVESEQAINF